MREDGGYRTIKGKAERGIGGVCGSSGGVAGEVFWGQVCMGARTAVGKGRVA